MRPPMTKEGFQLLLERQRKSGLSVKAFCRNEAYYSASFYYWKKKFCSADSNSSQVRANEVGEDFAPLRFPVPPRPTVLATAEDLPVEMDEIMIELPSGIKIRFRGSYKPGAAIQLINQLHSGRVLSQ